MPDERLLEFVTKAYSLRFSDEDNLVIDPHNLLIPRRREDRKRDLFSVFNIVQENLIKGGFRRLFTQLDGAGYWTIQTND